MFLSFASPLLLSGLWLTCSFGFVKGKKAREFEAEIKMLQDAFNRPLKDLRISVTDRCN